MIYGSCLHGADDETTTVPCPPIAAQDELHYVERSMVTNIIRSRVEETLELLRERIFKAGLESYSGRQVVLTGGGAHLNGIRELATHVLGKRVRIGQPHGVFGLSEELSQPDFAVATGLLKHVFDDRDEVVNGPVIFPPESVLKVNAINKALSVYAHSPIHKSLTIFPGAVMPINFQLPQTLELKPRIVVIGVGGAGGNAVNNMIAAGLDGVDFVVANTDAQALALNAATRKVQLGGGITQGLGAGMRPEIGEQSAEESLDEIMEHLDGAHMLFVAAGMGGGTGTGAAPVVARAQAFAVLRI